MFANLSVKFSRKYHKTSPSRVDPVFRKALVCGKHKVSKVVDLLNMAENLQSFLRVKVNLNLRSKILTHEIGYTKSKNEFFYVCPVDEIILQSNLVISNSLISNYRLSRSEKLVPVLT